MSFVVNQAYKDGAFVLAKKLSTTTNSNEHMIGVTAVLPECTNKTKRRFRKIKEQWNWIMYGIKLAMRGQVPELAKEKTPHDKTVVRQIKVRAELMMEHLNEWHSQYASQAHWYLKMIGTDPEHQGQGLGSTVMRKINELADLHELDLYLECGSETNRDFYLTFGYNVAGEHEVTDPTDTEAPIQVYCMLRKYQTKSSMNKQQDE